MPKSPVRNRNAGKSGALTATISCIVALAITTYFLALPSITNHQKMAKLHIDASQLQLAIANFFSDYNAYPIISPYGDHIGIADAELIHALNGTNPITNPNNTVYFNPSQKFLSPNDAFIDPWGTPYHVHIDTTFNRRIANPRPDPDRPEIPTTVLVYSAGPDRDPTTWQDNIMSWE
ncbi:MAG: hypothetical protein P8J87_18890 [Verrucomicrobiales bacterium]|nr:hypothetical protein [Verrucomicrobiales bacterium]